MSLLKTINDLKADRAKKIADARKIYDAAETEKREMTAQEVEQFDKLHDAADEMRTEKIERLEKQWQAEKDLAERTAEPVTPNTRTEKRAFDKAEEREKLRKKAFRALISYEPSILDTEEREASEKLFGYRFSKPGDEFRAGFLSSRPARTVAEAEKRAIGVGTSNAPLADENRFTSNLEKALLMFGGMRQAAMVVRTSDGNDMPMPEVDDTSNVGEILAENTAVNTQDVAFGRLVLQAYKYSSKAVLVSVELLQDSAVDIEAELGMLLGERIGRIQNQHFTDGTGTGQPNGLLTAATAVNTAGGGDLDPDDLFTLQHSVDPAYRSNANWMLHDSVLQVIRKMKDSDNQYLFMPGLAAGAPDTILGQRFIINQDMDSAISTNNDVVAYGDFSKYWIRDVRDIDVLVLRERYADQHSVGFFAYSRSDGDLRNAGTNPVKYLNVIA